MPTGNGNTVVLAWGNATNGGLDFYVRSPLAMHTDSQLFTLAKVSLSLTPNPFVNASTGGYWAQRHHLQDGSIYVSGGEAGAGANITLTVDANAQVRRTIFLEIIKPYARPPSLPPSPPRACEQVILVQVASQQPRSLEVTLQSVRPASTVLTYTLDYHCNSSTSRPDILLDPLPSPAPQGNVGLYHDNSLANGDPAFFNWTMAAQVSEAALSSTCSCHVSAPLLRLQGLGSLLGNPFVDPLDGRIFGLGLSGAAGRKKRHINDKVLASDCPAASANCRRP